MDEDALCPNCGQKIGFVHDCSETTVIVDNTGDAAISSVTPKRPFAFRLSPQK